MTVHREATLTRKQRREQARVERRALEQAEAIERTVMAGKDPGPLAGVPFGTPPIQ